MKSIMQQDKTHCYICGGLPNFTDGALEEHHVFFGAGRRKLSEKYGIKIYIHANKCHRNGSQAVHVNADVRRKTEIAGQEAFEEIHGTRKEFMQIFGRNYL